MPAKAAYAVMCVVLATTLACAGCGAAPNSAATATAAGTITPVATAAQAVTALPTHAATGGTVDVRGVASYVDQSNTFHADGLVTNNTGHPVNAIDLHLELFRSNGDSVGQYDFAPQVGELEPGESWPFDYSQDLTYCSCGSTAGWQAKFTVANSPTPTPGELVQRLPLDVVNPQITVHASTGDVFLTGELVNPSHQPAGIDQFAAALFDSSGNVAGAADFQVATNLLAPAGDASGADHTPYVIRIKGPVRAGTRPAYYLKGKVDSNAPDAFRNVANTHLQLATRFVDADNGVQVIANVTNAGAKAMGVRLVAGLYDQTGNVLDAAAVNASIEVLPDGSAPVTLADFANVNGDSDLLKRVVSATIQLDPAWSGPDSAELDVLPANNETTTLSSHHVTLQGTVVNTTTRNLDYAAILVVVHDAAGHLVAAAQTTVIPDKGGPFVPQASLPWTVDIRLPSQVDASTLKFDVVAQGRVKQ